MRLSIREQEMAQELMRVLGFEKTPDLLRYLLRSKWEEMVRIGQKKGEVERSDG
ncbi:hypothetical protein [Hydrogenivirga sp.]